MKSIKSELTSMTSMVLSILKKDKKARRSDSYLYLKVIEQISKRQNICLDFMTVQQFLEDMDVLGFPGFETVRRTRQKMQAEYPELSSTGKVRERRAKREEIFRKYAMGGA